MSLHAFPFIVMCSCRSRVAEVERTAVVRFSPEVVGLSPGYIRFVRISVVHDPLKLTSFV
jgi:hypothetical protein